MKRGFELDLAKYGAKFMGPARVAGTQLYHIGGGVGLRKEGDGAAIGELWIIPNSLWPWLDDIEQNGFCYTREEVRVNLDIKPQDIIDAHEKAWVYVHTYPGMEYELPVEGNDWHG